MQGLFFLKAQEVKEEEKKQKDADAKAQAEEDRQQKAAADAKARKEADDARKQKEQIIYTGFVAQDVEKAAKELGYNFSGIDAAKNDKDLYGLRYAEFVVPLVKAVQEQQQQIEALKKQIEELKAMIKGK